MLTPNTILQNRYLIERKLGQGGMGAVYQAVDKRFDTTVALKETLVTDEGLRKAFEREARLLNKLRHAALPHVIDYFAEGEGQFLVMQFIPGDDMAAMLENNRRPFAADQVVRWADQILAALEYLHAYDPPIVHRDIKPQNVKLTPQGEVILLDFGLSKGSAADASMAAGGASVAGFTPHFAPLEQIRGMGTNPRSDLYSLGATMYLLLTGVTPPDALERATATLGGRPDPLRPILELNPSVPPSVAQVLMIALSQMPENRWVSASAMRNALRESDNIATIPQRPAATVAEQNRTVPFSRPPSGPTTAPPAMAGPQPQTQYTQPPAGPSMVQQQGQFQTAQGLFNTPNQSSWPNQAPQGQMYAYPSVAPQKKSKVVQWTLFGLWVVLGFFISIFIAAILLVATVGDDVEPQITVIVTIFIYLLGVIGFFLLAKL